MMPSWRAGQRCRPRCVQPGTPTANPCDAHSHCHAALGGLVCQPRPTWPAPSPRRSWTTADGDHPQCRELPSLRPRITKDPAYLLLAERLGTSGQLCTRSAVEYSTRGATCRNQPPAVAYTVINGLADPFLEEKVNMVNAAALEGTPPVPKSSWSLQSAGDQRLYGLITVRVKVRPANLRLPGRSSGRKR